MPEPADSSLSRRGAWIGLRTLRQRPKIVDHTPAGEPIFEVRSVRLLLQPDADHFNRLETCSKCGRNVPGGPVFEITDLDRPSNPLICTTCVQAVAKPTLLRPGVRRPPPELPPAARKPVETIVAAAPTKADSTDRPGPTGAGAGQPAADRVVAEAASRQDLQSVTQLIEAQQRELGVLSEAVRATRAELRSATESQGTLAQSQRELHARMTVVAEHSQQAMSDGTATSAVERDLRHNLQFVTELLQAQQRELAALSAGLVETRNDLHVVTESQQALARSQQDLERRLADLAQSRLPGAEFAQRAESIERGQAEMSARLAEGLAQVRADTNTLVAKLRTAFETQARAVEAQLHQFESAGDAGARAELNKLAQTVTGLRTSSVEHGDRLDALQDELDILAVRSSALIDAGHAPSPAQEGDEAAIPPGPVVRGGLLDALERQLRDAEGRLAHLSSRSRTTPAE